MIASEPVRGGREAMLEAVRCAAALRNASVSDESGKIMPVELIDLLEKAWSQDPEERPTFRDI